jgi:hypothetical protein
MGFLDSVGSFITGGVGQFAEGICDTLGLPPEVGNIASGVTNFMTGNYVGLFEDAMELAPSVMDFAGQMFGTDVAAPGGGAGGAGAAGGGGGGGAGLDGAMAEANRLGVDTSGLKAEDAATLNAQAEAQAYQRMITLLTNLLQMQHEAQKSIIQNFRA